MRKVLINSQGKALLYDSKFLAYQDMLPPTGFVRVEYITTLRTAGVNTGIVVNSTDVIYATYKLDSSNLSQSGDKYIVSQQAGYTGGGIWVETYGSNNQWYVRFGSSSSSNGASTTDERTGKHQIQLMKQSFKIDGASKLTPNYSSMPSTPTCFGARINTAGDGITSGGMYGNLYEGTGIVDSNGNYRWWGIPVKRVSDGAGGMYDIVSDKVFLSVTGTDFTCGPEL